jgi:hypothetical protein
MADLWQPARRSIWAGWGAGGADCRNQVALIREDTSLFLPPMLLDRQVIFFCVVRCLNCEWSVTADSEQRAE